MTFEELPASAQETIQRFADIYGLEASSLLEPRQKTPEAQQARTDAINALDQAMLKGRRRYRLPDIAKWFGVTRNSIYVQRTKSRHFKPRRASSALTGRGEGLT